MVFLGGPHQAAGRRHILLHAATCAAFLIVGAATLSGCGGSSGENIDPNATPTPNTNATVRGRLIESTTTELVGGAVVRLGNVTATSADNGEFSIQVPGGSAAQKLTVELPAGQYFSRGDARGEACVTLDTDGISIAQTNLESGDNYNIGDIRVYSQVNPPPPPCNF